MIEGRQPVREALRAGRSIKRILIADGAITRGALAEIMTLARAANVRVERVPRAALDARATSRAHQGVIAEVSVHRARSWREGLQRARDAGEPALFLALDGIEDPQNAGALIRSAEVLGAHAVLLPARRAAQPGAAMGKAAAGAMEHLVVDVVPNLERALTACREEGLWIVALVAEADEAIDRCSLLDEPLVIVVGAEGKGVSALVRKRADKLVCIPTSGRIESLNASVAGAIALWEAARKRRRD